MSALAVVLFTLAAEPCDLQLSFTQKRTASELQLEAAFTNVTDKPVTVRVESRCPAPSLVLSGLPETFDPFQTCMKGMCMNREPLEKTLAPKERWVVATASLGKNDTNCGGPLREGPFTVTATVPLAAPAPAVCAAKPLVLRGWPARAEK